MAYLLFYRRRSSVPLGGPRFQRICDNFDNTSEADDDDDDDSDMAGLGEGRRLGDSSSPIGSSRLGNGVGATRRGANPGLARSTLSAQEDDDELPEYEESSVNVAGGNTIHRSIEEDEGIDVEGHAGFQPVQDWNFNDINMTRRMTPELGSEGGFQTTESGSVDEDTSLRDAGSPFESGHYDAPEQPPPPLDESAQATLSDIQTEAWERNNVRERMIAVPAGGDDDDAASTEAAEIHLTDEDQQVSAQRPPQP